MPRSKYSNIRKRGYKRKLTVINLRIKIKLKIMPGNSIRQVIHLSKVLGRYILGEWMAQDTIDPLGVAWEA